MLPPTGSPFRLALGLVAVASVLWGLEPLIGPGGFAQRLRMRADLRALQVDNGALSERSEALRRRIHGLKHQPMVQEQAIRDRLGWVRGGDQVLHLEAP